VEEEEVEIMKMLHKILQQVVLVVEELTVLLVRQVILQAQVQHKVLQVEMEAHHQIEKVVEVVLVKLEILMV
jgi:hypothetical protein